MREIILETPEEDVLKRIKQIKYNQDRIVIIAFAKKEAKWVKHNDSLITWQDKIYIRRDSKLREDIIRLHHDTKLASHPGRYKTQELITCKYWWPGVQRDIQKYIVGCDMCQRTKNHCEKPHAPLQPNEIPKEPWEIVSVDLIGELPESSGYNVIWVIADRFTKQIHVLPTHTTLTAEGLAKLYRDNIFRLHGIPQKFIHDREPQFASKFMNEFYRLLGIEANATKAYHPQTGGQTERIKQEVEQYLRVWCHHRQDDWADLLALAEFNYNDQEQSSTGYSPFSANYGDTQMLD